ncbi:ABC transporter ATP-binding protein [Brachybacterium fresconis]|uniref:ABC-2 type transport system ATP-binding protein n=1 Tax=Brachybacterium fresconis TaxID=173363 RepID=A0ABS4YGC1_9MICO|nr:ATP-binding cassette domain-containing protein [Brachybacterium fresconis]MBP2407845.1 ABC-2 type transport system ATP-binding protein [Brachybacterium fresconis]MDN5716100.1 ATP-binding cassette domain-containing protein [Janibacter sp.]MDN5737391.1 ATP-binding cassette domain-containing protein [Brevibacterium aurantiacum]MDN5773957.1 ATP-binding cassette domain-containing protein [Brevibacterium aurantiacum]
MLTFNELSKRRGAQDILTDISFQAKPGRVTGFLGPNGAGKSSTLRILLGLDSATSGTALVDGRDFRTLRDPLRKVGAVLDGSGAHRSRTGRAHLRWVARAAGIGNQRVEELLETVGISEAAGKRVSTYSLGMGRRLGLAAALLADPEALVLDEPVNGLDPEGIRWIRLFLRDQAKQGRTVLLSSHLMGELSETVDDVVIIRKGRIVANGTLEEITGGHPNLESAFFALTDEVSR